MDRQIHLVVPDLLLPEELARQACVGLHLPALEKILARAESEPLPETVLEEWLCSAFELKQQAIAPVTLQADRVEAGNFYWLRADPVNLRILHDQLVLQPAMSVSEEEAVQLCAALNEHFAGDGLHFIAPHPQRWYLRLENDPAIETTLLAQVLGNNVHQFLPRGREELRWHGILNEIQMLLHAHPLNEVREQHDEWQINGVWLWGGGRIETTWRQPFGHIYTDSELVAAFATVANIGQEPLPDSEAWAGSFDENEKNQALVVWDGLQTALQHGNPDGWRKSLQRFEQLCAYPLWQALRSGSIQQVTLDVLQGNASRRFVLTRHNSRKFWRRSRRLVDYSLV